MKMNQTIIDLENAIQLLTKTRIDAHGQISTTGLMKVFHATYALEAQLKALVSDSESR